MKKTLLLSLITLALAQPAFATNWVRIGGNNETIGNSKATYWYDSDSVRYDYATFKDGYKTRYVQVKYASRLSPAWYNDTIGLYVDEEQVVTKISCSPLQKYRLGNIQSATFWKNDKLVFNQKLPSNLEWETYSNASLASYLYDTLCN
ncbi:hypothetical protein L4G92_04280 [Neisseria sp. ZJ106]|uniref:Uncharacterized protein n=1 Tax=Neisseria lisongii TaxID=2912188 RepID=A0ABY7RJG6_9NEIS|nr:hypothetical protein [Neisseria lisongii]MCF7521271.1 hypothetical protein [Neisseria lisongii]WCL71762.1 hypothetical protein PJU73_01120 [Neisseria lisongii]